MCMKIIYGITFPIWYLITSVMIIIGISFIIQNKYDTNNCYDGLYQDLTMYKIFIINLITYLILSLIQILLYTLTVCNIITKKSGINLITDLICFIGISILNGLYLNFILSNTNNCLADFKINNINVYIYFILTFTFACMFEFLLLLKIISYSCLYNN